MKILQNLKNAVRRVLNIPAVSVSVASSDVGKCTIYNPTMKLRWFVTEVYIPELDDFEKILQQCWLDENGNEMWEDVPIFE